MISSMENATREVYESFNEKEKKVLLNGEHLFVGNKKYFFDRNLTDKRTWLWVSENNRTQLIGYLFEDDKTYYEFN